MICRKWLGLLFRLSVLSRHPHVDAALLLQEGVCILENPLRHLFGCNFT